MEHRIDINKLECVSRVPNGAVIFEQDFYLNPTVPDIVRSAWPGKQVALDDAQCPYGLYFTIISQTTRAVTYLGKPSKVFMSFQVCRRNADGRVDFNPCSYKNLYLFESGVKPLEAFEIGLRAFLRAQNEDWVVLTIQPENLGGGQ
jgi:hypothetical protein